MKKTIISMTMAFLISTGVTTGNAYAIGFGDLAPDSSSDISLFNYGWRGLLTGAVAGLAGGFVRYADKNNNQEVLRSVGYGTVAGAGFGLAAGIVDMHQGRVGFGNLLLKNMNLGGAFGMAVGSIYGGIDAIVNDDWKSLGNGASWGYLSGLVLGTGLAIYEDSRPGGTLSRSDEGQVQYSIVTLRDSKGGLCTGFGAARRF